VTFIKLLTKEPSKMVLHNLLCSRD